MVNRREFLGSSFGIGAAAMGLTIPVVQPAAGFVCRWYECSHGQHEMRIGYATDLDQLENYGATLAGTLWNYSYMEPNRFTFRFGRFFHEFEATTLADAKQIAGQKMVEWLRRLVVETERMVFA